MLETEFRRITRNRYRAIVEQYVPDVLAFGDMLRACDAVVSGSAALAFCIGPLHFHPNDLDIYTSRDTAANCVLWLRQYAGYVPFTEWPKGRFVADEDIAVETRYLGGRSEEEDETTGIKRVFQLVKDGMRIDVIQSLGSKFRPIARFWTTGLMNVMDDEGWLICYPSMMALSRTMISQECLDAERDMFDLVMKYRMRGFTVCSRHRSWVGEDGCYGNGECAAIWRYVGDEYCMAEQFQSGPRMLPWLSGMKNVVTWRLGGDSGCSHKNCGNDPDTTWEMFDLNEEGRVAVERWLAENESMDIAQGLRDIIKIKLNN